jgi:hypothetical protein
MTKRTNCIFCDKDLDGSDEHIIPRSINGRIHSKQIICSSCNSKFGVNVDTIVTQTFSQFIHLLGLKNARQVYLEDPEGKFYVQDKKYKVKPIKPELNVQKKDGLVYVTISGDEKNAIKLLEKQQKIFQSSGMKAIKLEFKRDNLSNPPLSLEIKLEIDSRLKLVLNKIALEFYAHNNLDTSIVKDLLKRVGKLDFSLDNVLFCNFNQEIRTFSENEISHLVALKNDSIKNTLFCYIELFNLVCVVVVLSQDYLGPDLDLQYRQEVISGKRIEAKVSLNLDLKNTKTEIVREDLSILIDLFCERHRDRLFKDRFDEGLKSIQEELNLELKKGMFSNEEYADKFLKQSAEYIAYLSVYEFPFAVADFDDQQDDMVNYIHSSMRESQFDEFSILNKNVIGLRIAFTYEDHDPEKCIMESFLKTPVGKIKGEQIIKVYCVLKNVENGALKYIPFRNLFEGLRRVNEEQAKK